MYENLMERVQPRFWNMSWRKCTCVGRMFCRDLGFGSDCAGEGKRLLLRGHECCLFDVCDLRKERGFVFGMRFVSMNKWMGSCWNLKSVGSLHSFMLLWSSCALSERGFILILFESAL